MAFIGDVAFVEGRSLSKTTTLVLRKCLGCGKQDGEQEIDGFLKGLSIKPEAFFKDIDVDWTDKPFVAQHVFKVVHAAGYRGTEDDLWVAVTGGTAPYATKDRGAQPKRPAVAKAKAAVGATRPSRKAHASLRHAD